MSDFTEVKAIAEQLLALSVELLRLVDMDESEHRKLIEDVKKMPAGKFYTSRVQQRRTKNKTINLL